uniref:Uncharacterized protein n=1 Tax=Rhizophora mucronata TaxID=61149 RepID=A0A2P2NPY6_RHIMU
MKLLHLSSYHCLRLQLSVYYHFFMEVQSLPSILLRQSIASSSCLT